LAFQLCFDNVTVRIIDLFIYFNLNGVAGNSRIGKQEPNTIVVRGVPSLWFSEPLVSSKASTIVSHTIFSRLGNIR
jgi:hypothetical protein